MRRAPSPIATVEDALLRLVRNAHDAGARRVFVASTLRRGRYRLLTILDDGQGIPEPYGNLIFEPGVTSRHYSDASAGLSLHHIRDAAVNIRLMSAARPTCITAAFDTYILPERSLQSASRRSGSNIRATLENFCSTAKNPPTIHHGTPTQILTSLIKYRIIQIGKEITGGIEEIREVVSRAESLGLGLSERSARRVLSRVVPCASEVLVENSGSIEGNRGEKEEISGGGVVMKLSSEETEEIAAILRRAAGVRYLELGALRVDAKAGELWIKARLSETEEEYE